MRFICAPEKFKGSLTAQEAAEAMARGIRTTLPDAIVDVCPIADGGEGTVETMLAAAGAAGRRVVTRVHGPLGVSADATWALLEQPDGSRQGVIEMVAASGLALVPADERDPTRTTTFGTGQLIAAALDRGVGSVLLGIGGSATTDGGCGAAQALGVRFISKDERVIDEPINGGRLLDIARIDRSALDTRLGSGLLTVACDVVNPLTGPDGAAHVYGPQKGATPAQVELLDRGLRHLAELIRQQLQIDIQTLPGAGAAGGLGGGMVAFLGAALRPGADLVLDAVRFDDRVTGCDLCLTGEGRLDGQSLSGKACIGVARRAAKHDVSTVAMVGSAGPEIAKALRAGLRSVHIIATAAGEYRISSEESMRRAGPLLEKATASVIRRWADADRASR